MQWKKDPGKKYTDLCIYIDKNIPNIVEPGEHPDIENTVYNYLWLVVKALAIKKCMFNNFQDYDPYAFYAANRLYFALKKNYLNQGKTIKGKLIRPIKSCLNYMKALLYPMKIEYQNETFREVISEEFVSKKFDSFTFKEQMRDEIRSNQGVNETFISYVRSTIEQIGSIADRVLAKSPFSPRSIDYKKLKMSLMLNAINSLKVKKKLDSDLPTILLWKLPKSMSSYVRILLKEFYSEIKLEIMECHNMTDISDDVVDRILQNSTEDRDNYEEQY